MDKLKHPEATYLPVLYGTDKKGKERLWKIWTIGNEVYRCYGLSDGEKITRKKSYQGVNKGRSNATTADEQAKLSMERMWTRQLDKGYSPKCKEGKEVYARVMNEKKKNGGNNRLASSKLKSKDKVSALPVEKSVRPMKAAVWKVENGVVPKSILKHFDFKNKVYAQWKLDGFRCVARLKEGKVVLTTNSGKQYPWLSNLREELKVFLKGGLDGCIAIDGELYTHRIEDEQGEGLDDNMRFSTIQSICGQTRKQPHALEDQICFFVFDVVDNGEKDQIQRFKIMDSLFRKAGDKCPHIKQVLTRIINSPKEVIKLHGIFAQQGFEGIIVRDSSLKYKMNYRSLKMRKYKKFEDREYVIVDVYLNPGVQKEDFVWVCATEDGTKFKAKPMGSREEKWRWYDERNEFIGHLLTVKFQEFSADGVPRFPIGKAIREPEDI